MNQSVQTLIVIIRTFVRLSVLVQIVPFVFLHFYIFLSILSSQSTHRILHERDGYQNLSTTYHWRDALFSPHAKSSADY